MVTNAIGHLGELVALAAYEISTFIIQIVQLIAKAFATADKVATGLTTCCGCEQQTEGGTGGQRG
jgi:hypothetical protein